jgi:MFS family permease
MSDPSSPRPSGGPILAPLASRDFRLWLTGQFASLLGIQILLTAVLWQLYSLTRNPLALGMVGLARLLPVFLCGWIGGAAADSFDRRALLLITQAGMGAVALTLAAVSRFAAVPVFFDLRAYQPGRTPDLL